MVDQQLRNSGYSDSTYLNVITFGMCRVGTVTVSHCIIPDTALAYIFHYVNLFTWSCSANLWCALSLSVMSPFCTNNGCCGFHQKSGTAVRWSPREHTVPELSDISSSYLEPPTTVTACCPAVIRTKQEVLNNYVTIQKRRLCSRAFINNMSVCLIYWVLKL